MSDASELADIIARLERRVEQLDRRLNNVVREARVTEVDVAKSLVKVEAHGLASAWSPWMEQAGAVRTWTPPTVGQRVLLVSTSGEPGQGIVFAGGYSDRFPAPSDDADAHVMTIGDLTITARKDKATIVLMNGGRVEVEKDFVRAKLGDSRFVVTSGLAKLRKNSAWLIVKDEEILVSHMPTVGPDPDDH